MQRLRQRRRSVGDSGTTTTLRSKLVYSSTMGRGAMEDLEETQKIGEGAFGEVYMMLDKATGQSRVLKKVARPDGWDDEQLKKEAEMLQQLDHPHVLRIFSWFEEHGTMNIVMEHCGGGEFLDVVREGKGKGEDLSVPWVSFAFRQVFSALAYCHGKSVVHRDLKSDNLLLLERTEDEDGNLFVRNPHLVVCDLGMAEVCSKGLFGMGLGAGHCKEIAGTPITMAPEVWKGAAGPKCDIWSMGVVMFQTFSNRTPFGVPNPSDNVEQLAEQWDAVLNKGPAWEVMTCDALTMQFCKQLLSYKEASRPSALECLKHAWIASHANDSLRHASSINVKNSLTSWSEKNPWQRAICLKLAVDCPSTRKFSSVFYMFDTDSSGVLSRSEVVQALQALGIEKNLAKKIASDLDINGDGSCEFIEFAAACLCALEDQFDEMLRLMFLKLDSDHDGNISDKELQVLISELRPIAQQHGMALGDLDANNDGVVSFNEFVSYFGRPDISFSHIDLIANLPMVEQVRISKSLAEAILAPEEPSFTKRQISDPLPHPSEPASPKPQKASPGSHHAARKRRQQHQDSADSDSSAPRSARGQEGASSARGARSSSTSPRSPRKAPSDVLDLRGKLPMRRRKARSDSVDSTDMTRSRSEPMSSTSAGPASQQTKPRTPRASAATPRSGGNRRSLTVGATATERILAAMQKTPRGGQEAGPLAEPLAGKVQLYLSNGFDADEDLPILPQCSPTSPTAAWRTPRRSEKQPSGVVSL